MADKQYLMWYLNDINGYIKEIKSSDLEILDKKRYDKYINFFIYSKERWKDEVLPVESGPNLVKKALIMIPVEYTMIEFREHIKNVGKQQLRDVYSNQVILMFESLLNKENISDEVYKTSFDNMLSLREHIRKDSSKYNDMEDMMSEYIYLLFKTKVIFNEEELCNIDRSTLLIVKPMIIEDAKSILNEKYESKTKIDIQNDIRLFLTLNDLDYDSKINELFNMIISLYRVDTNIVEIEQEIKVADLDSLYEEILNDLVEIKKENYGLYTYSLIYIYYSKKDSIDTQEFISELTEVKRDILNYRLNKENKSKYSKKQALINKINDSEDIMDLNIIYKMNFESNLERSVFIKYAEFENYKKKMLNGNLNLSKSDYVGTRETAILFSSLIINGYFEDSIIADYDKSEIINELSGLIESEEDLVTTWKINSYIRLLFGKKQDYINIFQGEGINSIDFNCQFNPNFDRNKEIVSRFYSAMILLYPLLPHNVFEEKFKNQLYNTLHILIKIENASFQPPKYTLKGYLEVIEISKNYYMSQPLISDGNRFKPYYKDFINIYSLYESKKNPLNSTVRIKKLNIPTK